MKKFTRSLAFIAIACLLIPVTGWSQSLDIALNNPVIMKYYTAEQLQELAETDTAELNSIVYYFTQSFTVEPVECTDCIPFDSAAFDITKWEYLRERDSVYTREFN